MRKSVVLSAASTLGLASMAFGGSWAEIFSGGANGATDAGQTLATANITDSGSSNPAANILNTITGQFVRTEDADIYCIHIVDPANFSASTTSGGDTNLALFDSNGVGVAFNDQRLVPTATGNLSTLTSRFVTSDGHYYLAVSRNDAGFGSSNFTYPFNAAGQLIFPQSTGAARRGEYGPAAANGDFVLDHWGGATGFQLFNANYSITLTGTEFCLPSPGAAALLGLGGLTAMRRRR